MYSMQYSTNDDEDKSKDIQCAECGSKDVVTDETRGERICGNCGLVAEARMINLGSEWRAYNRDEYNKRARSEMTSFSMKEDLSTYIGFENRDALGQTLIRSLSLRKKY